MIATGKKARKRFGTRFAAKRAKGGKGKTFSPSTAIKPPSDISKIHDWAMGNARRLGLFQKV